jgi:hypothetical protein
MNTKNRSANNGTQFVPMGLPTVLENVSSNNYIHIVYEELQHLFDFNFGVLARGIRVISNKVMFLVTDNDTETLVTLGVIRQHGIRTFLRQLIPHLQYLWGPCLGISFLLVFEIDLCL